MDISKHHAIVNSVDSKLKAHHQVPHSKHHRSRKEATSPLNTNSLLKVCYTHI